MEQKIPTIVVNGVMLSPEEAQAVRLAVAFERLEVVNPAKITTDPKGLANVEAYKQNLESAFAKMR